MSTIETCAREFIRLRELARQLRAERTKAFFGCECLDAKTEDGGLLVYTGTPCFKQMTGVAPDLEPLDADDYCPSCKRGVELGKQYRAAAHGQGLALRRLARAAREE